MTDAPSGARLVGSQLGHYRLLEAIGAGGMGEVYRARDEHLHRDVAVKVLPASGARDERARRLLRKEALALSRLNHPNIATVHDFDTQEGIDFLVMEYVPGVSVADTLARGPLPEQEIVDLAGQLVEGLAAAHARGVVHRDLKPANLRFTLEGRLKILDFGLAELVQPIDAAASTKSAVDAGIIAGTLPYMAPEQLGGGQPDVRTDIYAVGVVLYEMATGQRPFRRESPAALIGDILNASPSFPRLLKPDLSPGLKTVILTCLQKRPNDRYRSATALLEDVRRLATGTSPVARVARPPRAWWKTALAVGAPLVVLLVALSVWTSLREPTLAFVNRDWLLVTDFENLTGEAVFDKALDTALRVSIEQSSYVNVVPRRRATEALRRMKKENVQRMDEPIGREVAEREGIKALLVPSISGVGGNYSLSAVVEDPKTGRSIQSDLVRATKREDVLGALDDLARNIRRKLGESMAAIDRQGRPLAKVTTSSLEALKQYSLAIQWHRERRLEEAKTSYEGALSLDPGFTAAQASLGMLNYENFDREKGKALLAQAVEHVDSLTERERYGILAFHARAVENDLPKAVQHLKSLLALYPDHNAAHNNLAVYYRQMGQYDNAVAEYGEAIRTDPTFMLARDGLAGMYLYEMGDVKAGIVVCEAELALNDRHFPAWSNLGWAYLGKGDLGGAQAAIEKAVALDPRSTLEWYRIGHIHRLRGEYQAASRSFAKVLEIDASDSTAHYELGVIARAMKDEATANHEFGRFRAAVEQRIRSEPKNPEHYLELAVVMLRMGETEKAHTQVRKSMLMDPEQHFGLATFLSVQGRADKAIDQLEFAIQQRFQNYIWLTIHTDLDSLRDQPRFKALLNRMLKR
jgi:serine/threonine protein kinase/tetratricopeptide (TPR) repeat protein